MIIFEQLNSFLRSFWSDWKLNFWMINDTLLRIHFSSDWSCEWFVICRKWILYFLKRLFFFKAWKRRILLISSISRQKVLFLISMKKIVDYYQAQAQHLYFWSLFVTRRCAWVLKRARYWQHETFLETNWKWGDTNSCHAFGVALLG